MIRVTLTGANTATAGAISVTSRTPILSMCRTLIANGFDPRCSIEAYRGETLCLIVPTIGMAAALTVNEARGCNFSKWEPFPTARVRS
jgi:hypothetical protein